MAEVNASAIIEVLERPKYLLQLRDYKPRNWKGCYSLLGGGKEEGETPEQAMERELGEETNWFEIATPDERRPIKTTEYRWDADLSRVVHAIRTAYPRIPSLSPEGGLDKEKLKRILKDGIDYAFHFRIPEETLEKMKLKEGRMKRLYMPEECMALIIAANDRLQLLHHFAESGLVFE